LRVAVAAGLVAVGLTPLRERLQAGVDRLVYGDRHDPVRAVATLGRHVAEHDQEALVQQVLASVAAAVRSPGVALVDTHGVEQASTGAAGDCQGVEPLRLPLQVAARPVGCLLIAPRTARDGWSRADRELLAVLAQQVAVVAHAAQLNTELARSRDEVLTATADERRRLRQELHDGLGPALSGIALGLEAAEVSFPQNPERAGQLLTRLREETQTAGQEVRRLVEGLRPAALDSQNLTDALTTFVAGLSEVAAGRLQLSLVVAGPLPPLPPDLDAAAYRIVTEALTNVVRHSGARSCTVHVTAEGPALCLQVEDDGVGLPAQPRQGVGLSSMRQRAAELGGTWSVQPRPDGGTRLRVELPLRPAAATVPPPVALVVPA
jgi:signal transduction histidine kinase